MPMQGTLAPLCRVDLRRLCNRAAKTKWMFRDVEAWLGAGQCGSRALCVVGGAGEVRAAGACLLWERFCRGQLGRGRRRVGTHARVHTYAMPRVMCPNALLPMLSPEWHGTSAAFARLA